MGGKSLIHVERGLHKPGIHMKICSLLFFMSWPKMHQEATSPYLQESLWWPIVWAMSVWKPIECVETGLNKEIFPCFMLFSSFCVPIGFKRRFPRMGKNANLHHLDGNLVWSVSCLFCVSPPSASFWYQISKISEREFLEVFVLYLTTWNEEPRFQKIG